MKLTETKEFPGVDNFKNSPTFFFPPEEALIKPVEAKEKTVVGGLCMRKDRMIEALESIAAARRKKKQKTKNPQRGINYSRYSDNVALQHIFISLFRQ